MESDVYRATKRSYELGRLWAGVRHAAMVATFVGLLSFVVWRGFSWAPWLTVPFAAVAFAEWRGSVFMTAARRGVAAGVASMLLPLSILRPCCGSDAKAMAAGACCTMPSACWLTGAFVGLAMTLLLPQTDRRWEAAAGMLVGVTSLAVLRCSTLFIGEAVGLIGGLAAGILAMSLARLAVQRLRAARTSA